MRSLSKATDTVAGEIHVQNLSKRYQTLSGPVHALQEISLHVRAGEFVTIIGPSGCGKSTLLGIIGGMGQRLSKFQAVTKSALVIRFAKQIAEVDRAEVRFEGR